LHVVAKYLINIININMIKLLQLDPTTITRSSFDRTERTGISEVVSSFWAYKSHHL